MSNKNKKFTKILTALISSEEKSVYVSAHKYSIPFSCRFEVVSAYEDDDTIVTGYLLGVGESLSSAGVGCEFCLGRLTGDDPEQEELIEPYADVFLSAIKQEIDFLQNHHEITPSY